LTRPTVTRFFCESTHSEPGLTCGFFLLSFFFFFSRKRLKLCFYWIFSFLSNPRSSSALFETEREVKKVNKIQTLPSLIANPVPRSPVHHYTAICRTLRLLAFWTNGSARSHSFWFELSAFFLVRVLLFASLLGCVLLWKGMHLS